MWSGRILIRKMNKYIWKSTKVYTAFLFMGHAFWKENFEDRVKLLESNVLNWCLIITMADLWKVGLKVREWRVRELSSLISQRGWGHVPHSITPPPPPPPPPPPFQENVPLVHIFFLTGHEWSLTCWAKIQGEHCVCRLFWSLLMNGCKFSIY